MIFRDRWALQMNWQSSEIFRMAVRQAHHVRVAVWITIALGYATFAGAQVTFSGSQISLAKGTWSAPSGVAVDGKGNLFVADCGNNRVVELSPSGNGFGAPTTVLSGLSGPAGIAADWNGNLFVSDTGNNRVLMLPVISAGFGTPVTVTTSVDAPTGLALDSADDVYIADSGNNRVLEIPVTGGAYGTPIVLTTGLNNPTGVAVDASRDLYIADKGNNRLIELIYSSSGYAAPKVLWSNTVAPVSVAVFQNYNVYYADNANKRISENISSSGPNHFSATVLLGSEFDTLTGLAVNSAGNVYVTDSGTNHVVELTAGTVDFDQVNVGATASTLTYNFIIASGTTVGNVGLFTDGMSQQDFTDAGGSTCLAQTYQAAIICGVNVSFKPQMSGTRTGAVELFDSSGHPLASAFVSGTGSGPLVAMIPGAVTTLGAQLSGPSGVAVDGVGNVYIADTGNDRVVELPWIASGYGPQTTLPVSGILNPMGMAMDGAGDLFITSNGNNKVVKLARTGSGFGAPTTIGSALDGPTTVAVDTNGDVFVADPLNGQVNKYVWTGISYSVAVSVGQRHPHPTGVAVDGAGDVFVADPYSQSIFESIWTGTSYLTQITVQSGAGTFMSAVATDRNHNLYILDTQNNDVIMLPWNGSAFGKQIIVASGFNAPTGMTITPGNQLFVSDTGNNRVVKIDLSSPGSFNFEDTYLGSTSADSARSTLIESVGNQPLTIDTVSFPQDFPEAASVNACADGLTLTPGQSCEVAVNFTPSVAGASLAEAVTIVDDAQGIAGSEQLIPVAGASLNKLEQSISFPSVPTVVYGAAPITLSATASSGLFVTYTVVSGPGSLKGQTLRFSGAGTVVIQGTQSGSNAYSAAPAVEISIVVIPATLTVTPVAVTASYGSIPTSFSYSIVGLVNGDNASTAYSGKPSIMSNATATSNAGSYLLTASQGTLSSANYTFVFGSATLTVSKALVKVTATSVSRFYGAPMSAFAWSMSGFHNSDTASVVTGVPVLTSIANSGSPVGSYPIQVSVGALSATNYQFQGVNGTLTITPAVLTVTGANQSMTYGGTIPPLSYWISGFHDGDNADCISGAPAVSTSATAQSGVGSYPIVTSVGTLAAANYTFKFALGVISITKAFLLVQPNDSSTTYGHTTPAFSFTLSGFVNGDTSAAVTGVPKLTTSATPASKPGSYLISSSFGSLTAKNYSFVFGTGTLTISQAVLTVTPKPVSATYGGALPALSYQLSGFVNGDGPGVVTGAPVMATSATSTSAAGVYPVTITQGSLSAANYTFSLMPGQLIINKANLTVIPANQSMTYGGPVPAFTYSITGFVEGDSQATATTGTPSITSAVTSASPAGQYAITASLGTLASTNYAFVFAAGSIKVNKATLTVTANNLSMTAGSAVPALTFTITGWVNGDTQASFATGTPALSTGATSGSLPGTYAIVITVGSLQSSNYQFVFVKGTLTITAPPQPSILPRYRMANSIASRDSA